jgi:hypothetical protein
MRQCQVAPTQELCASGKLEGSGWSCHKTKPEQNQSQQDQTRAKADQRTRGPLFLKPEVAGNVFSIMNLHLSNQLFSNQNNRTKPEHQSLPVLLMCGACLCRTSPLLCLSLTHHRSHPHAVVYPLLIVTKTSALFAQFCFPRSYNRYRFMHHGDATPDGYKLGCTYRLSWSPVAGVSTAHY